MPCYCMRACVHACQEASRYWQPGTCNYTSHLYHRKAVVYHNSVIGTLEVWEVWDVQFSQSLLSP